MAATLPLADVQSRRDERNIPIDQVGVSDLRYPIVVLDRDRGRQETVARISMSVSLPHEFKGTHMSRFIEVLGDHRGEVTLRTLPALLHDLKARLGAECARVEVAFPCSLIAFGSGLSRLAWLLQPFLPVAARTVTAYFGRNVVCAIPVAGQQIAQPEPILPRLARANAAAG